MSTQTDRSDNQWRFDAAWDRVFEADSPDDGPLDCREIVRVAQEEFGVTMTLQQAGRIYADYSDEVYAAGWYDPTPESIRGCIRDFLGLQADGTPKPPPAPLPLHPPQPSGEWLFFAEDAKADEGTIYKAASMLGFTGVVEHILALEAEIRSLRRVVHPDVEGLELAGFSGVPVFAAREIGPDSWLRRPSYEWFIDGYNFACTKARALPALSQVAPEDLYFATWAILRGAGLPDPEAAGATLTPPFKWPPSQEHEG